MATSPQDSTPPGGSSRFNVVFSSLTGSRKQRAKREGVLSISYDVTHLYDIDRKECVMRCKGSGAGPNKAYALLEQAHRGADWTTGTEISLCGFEMVVEDVMELHLIPYNEDVPAAALGTCGEVSHAGGPHASACAHGNAHRSAAFMAQLPPPPLVLRTDRSTGTHTATEGTRTERVPSEAPVSLLTAPTEREGVALKQYAAVPTPPLPLREEIRWPPAAMWTALPKYASPSVAAAVRGAAGSTLSDALRSTGRRRQWRSAASLSLELKRCYPHYF